jgi:pimeloyl-ACP methyl ester carboxylesterase
VNTLTGGWPGVDRPTTYVWGRRDPALGRAAALGTQEHVSGDYRFVELDAGHWLPELHPAQVADAVLDRVGRAA